MAYTLEACPERADRLADAVAMCQTQSFFIRFAMFLAKLQAVSMPS